MVSPNAPPGKPPVAAGTALALLTGKAKDTGVTDAAGVAQPVGTDNAPILIA